MLNPEEFDRTMRQWLSKDHFVPFVVELDDGRQILISEPSVAFGGGGAGFIDPVDGALIDITCDHVVGFHAAGQEIGA